MFHQTKKDESGESTEDKMFMKLMERDFVKKTEHDEEVRQDALVKAAKTCAIEFINWVSEIRVL